MLGRWGFGFGVVAWCKLLLSLLRKRSSPETSSCQRFCSRRSADSAFDLGQATTSAIAWSGADARSFARSLRTRSG